MPNRPRLAAVTLPVPCADGALTEAPTAGRHSISIDLDCGRAHGRTGIRGLRAVLARRGDAIGVALSRGGGRGSGGGLANARVEEVLVALAAVVALEAAVLLLVLLWLSVLLTVRAAALGIAK